MRGAEAGGGVMTIYHVKPYRGAWLRHLLHFQFRTACCALFGIARWHIPARRCRIIVDEPGLTITLKEVG